MPRIRTYILLSSLFHILMGTGLLAISWSEKGGIEALTPPAVLDVALVDRRVSVQPDDPSTPFPDSGDRAWFKPIGRAKGSPAKEEMSVMETAHGIAAVKDFSEEDRFDPQGTSVINKIQSEQPSSPPINEDFEISQSIAGDAPAPWAERVLAEKQEAIPSGALKEGDTAVAGYERHRFLREVKSRLEKAKRYPWLARVKNLEGTVGLEFYISSSGRPEEIRLVKSSGWKILDDEGLATVRRIGRFPPLPPDWREGIHVRVPMIFRLENL